MVRKQISYAVMFGVVPVLMFTSGCAHKYENPITKDTQQPDKVLFDTSIDDIEHGRYERARLTLQTMMNTYDTSEYLAKAKLAMADSWKREGGAHGLAQAEAEYKDFILFYPSMEEAAEAQYKICDMQFQQLDKSDRDPVHARLANEECKDLLLKWPNSKFAPDAASKLRETQEVLADNEMKIGLYYNKKGGNGYFSSANRLNTLVNTYPLYSQADEALWVAADDYNQLGDKYENNQAEMYARIVKDYPLSVHVADAKAQLKAMGRAVPDADPVAETRMKYELENRTKRGLMSKLTGPFSSHPNTINAAKSGSPQMESFKPTIPLNVPATAQGIQTTNTVSIGQVEHQDIIDKAPDARATATPVTPAAPAATTDAAKPADANAAKPADANATTPTGANATAAAVPATINPKNLKNIKPPKPPKPTTPKKRAKPSEQKSTAPPPAPAAPATGTAPAAAPAAPAKSTGGGGGQPEAPQR
jgi:outer membrane protein assembly factor BamD